MENKVLISPKLDKNEYKSFKRFCVKLFNLLKDKINTDRSIILASEKDKIKIEKGKILSNKKLELLFVKSIVVDLLFQDWELHFQDRNIYLLYPLPTNTTDLLLEKDRIRKRHLLARDEQLRQKSVIEFIEKMERNRLTVKGWHSIFSLMRNGNELADDLKSIAEIPEDDPHRIISLEQRIQPYIQFVEPNVKCNITGLLLSEIWRYFRLTWVKEYKSLPGRSILILIRDSAAPNHPVIGIAALGSAVAQQGCRDEWIGWDPESFTKELKEKPAKKYLNWLQRTYTDLLKGVYLKDLIADGVLTRKDITNPTQEIIGVLKQKALKYKEMHVKFPHKSKANASKDAKINWEDKAEAFLFKSKRCLLLADIMSISIVFKKYNIVQGGVKDLTKALQNKDFEEVVSKLIRRAKAIKVGIDMMEIIVCGAIAPYNHILGGKLVCMLLTSPEIVKYYKTKYCNQSSLIASSMSGKPVVRDPNLVFLGTTSLYGSGSSQYNRLKVPAEKIGGKSGQFIEYKELGISEGFGSFHFSNETLFLGNTLVGRRKGGKRVNSIFGEGANPLMRKIRESFELMGLESEPLLKHGSKRIVYGIPLATNFREVLKGFETKADYFLPLNRGKYITQQINNFWLERWLNKRINNPNIIADLRTHSLSYPITHGARIPTVYLKEDPDLFST